MQVAIFYLPRCSLRLPTFSAFSLGKSTFTHQKADLLMYNQKATYVQVKMKWKKDSFYDSIESIHRSHELKAVISLKNCIIKEPCNCLPISAVSKRGDELGIPIKVTRFIRTYPSIFEELTGEKYNLPWFRLTPEAMELHEAEQLVYETYRGDLISGLKKLVMMTKEKMLPLKIVQGLQWYLGLPDDFVQNPEDNFCGIFDIVEMEDGIRGLKLINHDEVVVSEMQNNAAKSEGQSVGASDTIAFLLFPSKGLRLKRKILTWLDEFQRLPYVSPYVDSSYLNPSSDISEKRVVGVLHELLCLFVEHSAQRKKLLCLRKHLGLPQKFYRAFDRHPHIFYLSLKNMTCTAILKEAYNEGSCISKHPISEVRMKYIRLMKQSEAILKERRRKPPIEAVNVDMSDSAETKARAGSY